MIAFVLLALVASASAGVFVNDVCPDVKPVENFDFKAFGSGKWYELAKYPNKVETGGVCGWAEYVLNGDVFSITNYDVSKNKLRLITGSGKLRDDAGTSGRMIFSYPYGAGGSISEHKVYALYSDDKTTVLYYCQENADKKTREDYSWIFSRSKTFEGNSKASVEKYINDNTFLDYGKFAWTDFSDDACKYEA
ncbi:bilin-binding protein [Bicyclus anynana]|uniref:Bilin-binding protein n=1 Tax=Bicyclus anynana TaxID=110368 RepID=A0A6J1N1A0_BICAN|nr:bilin-binding protein [Bicyclus anynana]